MMAKKMFRRHITDETGAFYVDAIIAFMLLIALVFSFLTIPELLIKKQELDYFANAIVRKIERDGMASGGIRQTVNELQAETGIAADVSWSGPFRGADAKLQIREKFTVTASYTVKIKLMDPSFGAPVFLEIPIKKTLTGVSEVYWKGLT